LGLIQASFLQTEGWPFAEVLSEDEIQQAFADEGVDFAQEEDEIYTPPLTLWAFLWQVLHKGEQRSCVAAVSRVVVLLVALGREPCAKNTGAYCRARAKLPEKVIERLAVDVARGCEAQVPQGWLWHQRHVKMIDGTTCSMPDTEENRAAYPQHSAQKEGLGFPLIRIVVALSLATAMLCSAAMGPYSGKETGETALLREVLDQFTAGDILLASGAGHRGAQDYARHGRAALPEAGDGPQRNLDLPLGLQSDPQDDAPSGPAKRTLAATVELRDRGPNAGGFLDDFAHRQRNVGRRFGDRTTG
jgi:hypothetical protein